MFCNCCKVFQCHLYFLNDAFVFPFLWLIVIIQLFHGYLGNSYCPWVVEKIRETVDRGRRLMATVSQIFSTTEGQWFDCSPSSLEITVLLPNCFKSPKHCNSTPMLVVDVGKFDVLWRHFSRDQSTVHCWPVNSFFCRPLTQKLQNYRATVKNMINVDLNLALGNKINYQRYHMCDIYHIYVVI